MNAITRWQRRRALRRPGLRPEVRGWLEAPWPNPRVPWRDASYTVLDLETTGLDRRNDAILEIGTVDVIEGRVRLDSVWQTFVRPPESVRMGIEAIRVHGLLPEQVAQAPDLFDVLPALVDRLRGRILVVHVGDFDRPFLDRALRAWCGCGLWMPVLDTARLAAWFDHIPHLARPEDVDRPLRRLCDLARHAGIPVGRQHDAVSDAMTCAQLLLALGCRLEGLGITQVGQLLRAGG